MYDEKRLIELTSELALQRGTFTLASGKTASFYLDCRKLTLDGCGANLVAQGILDQLGDDLPDCIGGMAIGADPISAAVITVAWQQGKRLSGFIVRKQAKAHGTEQLIEGPVRAGQRAVIVEDVVTSGGSLVAAVERARDFGLQVDRAIAIVDRLEGGAKRIADSGVTFHSLINIEQLGIAPTTV